MKKLYNTVDKRILKERIAKSNEPRTTVSFYKYHQIENPQQFRDDLFLAWTSFGVLGRTYVANEGINAQISVLDTQFDAFKNHLYSISFLNNVRLNTAVDDNGKSFFALRLKVRPKIVADGIEDPNFDPSNTGKYLNAEEFNAKMSDPNTVVVDMRNHYESEVGHFDGALLPDVDTFREEIKVVEDILKNDKDKQEWKQQLSNACVRKPKRKNECKRNSNASAGAQWSLNGSKWRVVGGVPVALIFVLMHK